MIQNVQSVTFNHNYIHFHSILQTYYHFNQIKDMISFSRTSKQHDYFSCKKECAKCNLDCENDYLQLQKSNGYNKLSKYHTKLLNKKYPIQLIYNSRVRLNSKKSRQNKKLRIITKYDKLIQEQLLIKKENELDEITRENIYYKQNKINYQGV